MAFPNIDASDNTACDNALANLEYSDTHHVAVLGDNKPWKCSQCDKSFSMKYRLTEHMTSHSEERPFLCPSCGKGFKRPYTLKCHVKKVHGEVLPPPQKTSTKELDSEKGDLLNNGLGRKAAVKENKSDGKTVPKMFNCSHCDKSYTDKSRLKLHIMTHTGDLPHKCTLCDKSYTNKTALVGHMRNHTGERLSCHLCDKTFVRKCSLRRHLRLHRGIRPYVCPLCQKCYGNCNQLKSHLVGHQKDKELGVPPTLPRGGKGEQPYQCPKCNRRFGKRTWFKRHLTVGCKKKRKIEHPLIDKQGNILTDSKNSEHALVENIASASSSTDNCTAGTTATKKKELSYQCGVCRQIFDFMSELVSHVRSHDRDQLVMLKLVPKVKTDVGLKIADKKSNDNSNANLDINFTEPNQFEDEKSTDITKGLTNEEIKVNVGSSGNLATDFIETKEDIKLNSQDMMDIKPVIESDIDVADCKISIGKSSTDFVDIKGHVSPGTENDRAAGSLSTNFLDLKDCEDHEIKAGVIKRECDSPEGNTVANFSGMRESIGSVVVKLENVGSDATSTDVQANEETNSGNVVTDVGANSIILKLLLDTSSERNGKDANSENTTRASGLENTEEGGKSNTKFWTCSKCAGRFRYQVHFKSHKCTNPEGLHVCNVCGAGYSLEEQLLVHMKQMHQKRSSGMSCSVCGAHFSGKRQHDNHKKKHGKWPHQCSECKKAYKNKGHLIAHMQGHAKKSAGAVVKRYDCTHCDKTFNMPSLLREHMWRHTDVKPYGCSVCNKSYTRSTQLRCHMIQHSGENSKKVACHVCKKKFSSRGALASHLRRHSSVRPYNCMQCNKSYSCPTYLRLHMIGHQKDKELGVPLLKGAPGEHRYQCPYCHRKFKIREYFRRHITHKCKEKFESAPADDVNLTPLSTRGIIDIKPMPID